MTSENVTLKKALGFWWLYAIGVGAVVGDGIFTFTGYGVASAGPSMVLVYILVGLSQLFLMISFGELVVWHPTSGGPEVWVRKLVGWDWGATSSLLFSIGWVRAGGSTGLAIGAYTHNFLGHMGINLQPADLWITVLAIMWLTLFAWLNVRGVDVAARTQFILVIFLVGIVVVYAAAVTPYVKAENFTPFMPSGLAGTFNSIPIAVYAFMGASTVLFASEEAKNPVDVSRVLFWSSITFVTVYTWALFAAVGTVPYGDVEKFLESLYVTSANRIYGPVFANALNAAAWTAAATCLLMGTIYQPPRDLYNLSRSGYKVPAWMGNLHPFYRTPAKNIWVVWALSVLLVLVGQAAGQTTVYQLLGYELVWVWCVSWVLTLKAAFAFRSRYPEELVKLPWRVPFWPVTPILGAIGVGLCIFALFQDLWMCYGLAVTSGFAVVSIAVVFLVKAFVVSIKPDQAAQVRVSEE
ncbi:MAG: branched-chain amino acid transporter BcaP [Thermovirga sp.]